jgi:hypothetical protein
MTITTTEEAELLARMADLNGPTRRGAAIRSLAAEREALLQAAGAQVLIPEPGQLSLFGDGK